MYTRPLRGKRGTIVVLSEYRKTTLQVFHNGKTAGPMFIGTCRNSFLNSGEPSRARTCDPLIKSEVTITSSGYGFYDLLTLLQVAAASESICYHLFRLISLWCCHKFVSTVWGVRQVTVNLVSSGATWTPIAPARRRSGLAWRSHRLVGSNRLSDSPYR